MSSRRLGWTGLLKREGAEFLAWATEERVLSTKFSLLATAVSTLLRGSVRTPEAGSRCLGSRTSGPFPL